MKPYFNKSYIFQHRNNTFYNISNNNHIQNSNQYYSNSNYFHNLNNNNHFNNPNQYYIYPNNYYYNTIFYLNFKNNYPFISSQNLNIFHSFNSNKVNKLNEDNEKILLSKNMNNINKIEYNTIYIELVSLNKLLTKKKKKRNKEKIEFSSIRENLFKIFDIEDKEENEIFKKIFLIIQNNNLLDEEENIINLLTVLNNFISSQIIINKDENLKQSSYEYFIRTILNLKIKNSSLFHKNYISFFEIKEKLCNLFIKKDKNQLINFFKNVKNPIYLIKTFNLQEKYPFKFFKIPGDDFSLITDLYSTYNLTEKMMLDLNSKINVVIKKNTIPFEYIEKIIKVENSKIIEKSVIKNLLKFPSNDSNDETFSHFFKFIFKNGLDIYFPFLEIPNYLNFLVFNIGFINSAFTILKLLPLEKLKKVSKNLLRKMLYSFDYKEKEKIIFILDLIPEEFNNVIKDYIENNKNNKYLKALLKHYNVEKLNDENCEKLDKRRFNIYYKYKIKKYFENQFDTLIELINEQEEFNYFFPLILKKKKN